MRDGPALMLHSARGEALALALRSSSCALPGDAGEGKLKASAFSAMAAARRSLLNWCGRAPTLAPPTLFRPAAEPPWDTPHCRGEPPPWFWRGGTASQQQGMMAAASPVCELYKVIVQCAQPEFAAPEAPHCEMGTKGSPPLSVVTGANSGVGEWLYKTYS